MEVEEYLLELGLTKNEALAYNSLIQHGKLGAGEISKYSGVSYSRIYDVLASLERKGFIKIIPEKSKKFVPQSPDQLNEILSKKEESFKLFREKIKSLKSIYEMRTKDPVILGYGKNAFYKIIKEMNKAKKIDYNIKWTSEYRPEWEAQYKEGVKKGVDNRVLCRYDGDTTENIHKWKNAGRKKIKKFGNKGVVVSIVDNEVLITLINQNVTFLIRDAAFSDVMSRLFLDSYKNAEEIE